MIAVTNGHKALERVLPMPMPFGDRALRKVEPPIDEQTRKNTEELRRFMRGKS